MVVIEDYLDHSSALPALTRLGVRAAAAAPIRQDGKPVGSLVVASTVVGRRFRETEREALVAFAEHASLAVTDAARTRHMLHSALHDALTGLPNRALFSDRLDQRSSVGAASRPPTAVLFLDVDAQARQRQPGPPGRRRGAGRDRATSDLCVRTEDTVARLGGDEFTVLLDTVTAKPRRCPSPTACSRPCASPSLPVAAALADGQRWRSPGSGGRGPLAMRCVALTSRCTRPRRAAVARLRSSTLISTSARCAG